MGNDLGWAWKPPEEVKQADANNRYRKRIKKKERKRGKKLSKSARQARLPSGAFYNLKRWRHLRWRVLKEYGRKCMKCDAVDVEIHVDHIKPRSKRPDLAFSFDNLQVLCKDCNMEKSNKNANDYREAAVHRGMSVES